MTKILPYTGVEDGQPRIREEQEIAIQRMVSESTKSIANASNMDTGKTLQAAEFVVRLGLARVLYVGVKDTFGQWADRLADQSDGGIVLLRIDATKQGKINFEAFIKGEPGHYFSGSQYLAGRDWTHVGVVGLKGRKVWKTDKTTRAVITKPGVGIGPALFPVQETKRKHLATYAKMPAVDAIIFDEVHVVGNKKSIGIQTLRTIKTEWKIAMSGTMAGNKFPNMHTIARWLWPSLIDVSPYRWAAVWCATETVYIAGKGKEVISGELNPGAFVDSLPCYIRLEGEADVPKPELYYVDLTPEQRADYTALEKDMLVWLNANPGLAPLVANLPIAQRARLRTAALGTMSITPDGRVYFAQDTISTKLYALRQIVDRPTWAGKQVAIYTHSKTFAKVVVARMQAAGYDAVEWSGDISSKRRDEIKADFLAGRVRYIVAVIGAFGTGLDGFQRVCSKIVWLSEDDNNKDNLQAVRRFFRTGVNLAEFEHVKIVAHDTHDLGIFGKNNRETAQMQMTMRVAA